ncbi:hypothetical protein [Weissella viridescens]|uniref:hypothetical protein n=1 Tax=Weissella viridescens TaxID=1629 RepID=UPI00163AABF6|nr:hypothetical protein [Weissella viridescens]
MIEMQQCGCGCCERPANDTTDLQQVNTVMKIFIATDQEDDSASENDESVSPDKPP